MRNFESEPGAVHVRTARRNVGAIVLCMLAPIAFIGAQGPACARARAADPAAVLTQCDVDLPARLVTQRMELRFPEILAQARMEGHVVALLDVDSSGRATTNRLHNVMSTHELFSMAVRRAVPSWRFEPARKRGIPVAVRVAIEIDFLLPTPPIFISRISADVIPLPDGMRLTTGWESYARDSSFVPESSARAEATREMLRYALATLVALEPGQLMCARDILDDSLRLTRAARQALQAATGLELRRPTDCPRTYASMIRKIPPERPPVGHVDPIWLSIQTKAWAPDFFIHTITLESGTSGRIHECATRKGPGDEHWRSYCSNSVKHVLH